MRTLRGVVGWQKTSFIDFPGTISTVLFYSGCNLRCPFCHNPGLVDFSGAEVAPDPDELERYLAFRRGKLTGVVLSGGEPTLHGSSAELAREFHSDGYRIKLDTNGLLPGKVGPIDPDYLAVDIKTDPERYATLLGCSLTEIESRLRQTIDIVRSMGRNAEVRTTVAPGVVDRAAIAWIGPLIEGVERLYLQPMQQRVALLDPSYQKIDPVAPDEILFMRDMLLKWVPNVEIRGL